MKHDTEIIIFYQYTSISNPEGFAKWQRRTCGELGLTGRILVASEGINGTIEGTAESLQKYENLMHAQEGGTGSFGNFSHTWFKHSPGTGDAFPKLKVKVRKEIVTLGIPKESDIDPNKTTGTHITPEELKSWIDRGEDFTIVDMRNDYEYNVGHFKNSINPEMENFRDLPKKMQKLEPLRKKKVLTVCTYGVRCEKASGYLKQQGFEDVYQLNGGIGTYMKAYPGEDFLGSLFVFDNRMTERFTDNYEVVGTCIGCREKSEHYSNCGIPDCHKKIIVCENCLEENGKHFCSDTCRARALSMVS